MKAITLKLLKGVRTLTIGMWQDFTMDPEEAVRNHTCNKMDSLLTEITLPNGFDSLSLQENANTESVFFCSTYPREDTFIFRDHLICRL